MKPRVWCLFVGVLLVAGLAATQAAQFGNFTYESSGTAVTITRYTGPGGAVTIPDTIDGLAVTSIGEGAFVNCVGLTGVMIPDSVESIGESAFSSCPGLTSIAIPNSVTTIGRWAFGGCTGLTSVVIPNSVTSIEGGGPMPMGGAFAGCTGLTNVVIGNSVTSIGGSAFSGCTGLTSIAIPNSVTSIGFAAFSGCTGLLTITVNPLSLSFSSADGVLFDKSQTTLMAYPGGRPGAYTNGA